MLNRHKSEIYAGQKRTKKTMVGILKRNALPEHIIVCCSAQES